ncbi:alpha/beta fold hydrolase [Algiphilus sp.]|uniref:alpha/beta fold hydrolase n=1 Tax=Algiphilus sp. TaxID=1872431 RepID=UPI002A5C6C08|nr:lysophospholipase [Pseudomonadota bacterium]
MPRSSPLICFNHGKESGPWGIKIKRLADVARAHGFAVVSPDYTHTFDPHERLEQLVDSRPEGDPLVMVGSSMGGYVAAHACARLSVDALFLLAPALYFPAWPEEPNAIPEHCAVLHGLHDDIVPPQVAERFCQRHGAVLHWLDAGHTLNERLDEVAAHFARFIAPLATPSEPA